MSNIPWVQNSAENTPSTLFVNLKSTIFYQKIAKLRLKAMVSTIPEGYIECKLRHYRMALPGDLSPELIPGAGMRPLLYGSPDHRPVDYPRRKI